MECDTLDGFDRLPKSDELIQALKAEEDLKVNIKYLHRQHVKKWNASKVTFKVQHKGSNLPNIEETLLEMLKNTIKKKKMHKNDRIRLIISHNNLDKPLSTKLIKVGELDVSKVSSIGNTVEYKEFSLEEAEITIETIKLPRGAGRTKPGLTLNEQFIRQKRSTVEIKAKDGCLPRCLVVGMTYFEDCPYTEAECKMIRNTSKSDSKLKLQEIKAREICTQAGLQFDSTYELEDIKKFEEVCNVKVIVYDFKLDCLYNNKSNVNPRKNQCYS